MYEKISYEIMTGVTPGTLSEHDSDEIDNPADIDRLDDFAMQILGEHIAEGVSTPLAVQVTVNGDGDSVKLLAQLDWVESVD